MGAVRSAPDSVAMPCEGLDPECGRHSLPTTTALQQVFCDIILTMSSKPAPQRRTSATMAGLGRLRASNLPPIPETRAYAPRRPTTSLPLPAASKPQRTSKTSQKLVVLPSAIQVQPLPRALEPPADGEGPSTSAGEHRSEGERMSKEQRQRSGYKRLTAYCIAEAFRMKLLTAFLKREHGVAPRVFDEAVYAVSFYYY